MLKSVAEFKQWTAHVISLETLTLTTELSGASFRTFRIIETLALTTEPSEAPMDSMFHITETLALTIELSRSHHGPQWTVHFISLRHLPLPL